jgi:outer membrane protein W
MKSSFIVIAAALLGSPAFAQEVQQEVQTSARSSTHAANNALEITLGAGYAQGFGDIGAGQRSLTDQTSAGGEITLGVGYRVNPNVMIGLYGSGAKYGTRALTSGADIWTATAGAQANYHFQPDDQWDPWIGLGSGWRGQWISSTGTETRHGWDIARLTAGVDYRVSSEFAVSPYIGAGVTTFLSQERVGEQSFSNINSPNANIWLFGGIQGRFDLFGSGSPSPRLASN